MPELIVTKQCSKCKQTKPLSEFYKHPSAKDGHFGSCKECKKKYTSQYRKTEIGKTKIDKYWQSEKGKLVRKVYSQSAKGKASMYKYSQSDKREITKKRFLQSEKGKLYIKRCSQTEKRKAYQREFAKIDRIRHPERHKARDAVKSMIKNGAIPKASALKCHNCPSQAKEYHHHNGYAQESWLDVIPVCKECHIKAGY